MLRPGSMAGAMAMACGLALACWSGPARGQTAPDITLESTGQLLARATAAAKTGPVARDNEASQILTALRTSRDAAVLPLFERVRRSTVPENQVYGMVAGAVLQQQAGGTGAQWVDVELLLAAKDTGLVGSAIASLIDAKVMSAAQMKEILARSTEASHRAMVAGELQRLKELPDRAVLKELLADKRDIVKFYTSATMLAGENPEEVARALDTMMTLSATHNLQNAPVEALMLVRVQKDALRGGIPWAAQIAADEACDMGLRYTAVATLLSLKAPQGAAILTEMLKKPREVADEVKLGLIAVEYAGQLRPEALQPLVQSRSSLVKRIAALAQKAASGADNTADLLVLLKEGHPIVLDWAMAYSDRAPERRVLLRNAVIQQATIVDNIRDRDYERAALAVERMLADDGAEGRKVVADLLKSERRAVVEATLAGIYRSEAAEQSDLVLPIWEGLKRTTSTENSTNYAALIMAREGRKEPLAWLAGMVAGGTVQGAGFRTLAGWYHARLNGQAETLLQRVLAE